MRWEPKPHHRKALEYALRRTCAGLLLDPGLGKTSVMLAAISILKQQKLAKAALVLAPLRVAYSVWPVEAQKWSDFRHLSVAVLHGPEKDARLAERHDVYVMNYEGLPWLLDRLSKIEGDWPFDVLVVDESSKVRNMQTQRFRMLRQILKRFRRRYILTGSPAPNSLLDLFGQVYVMDLGATFGPYFTGYRRRFFYPTGYGGYEWRLKDGAEDEIHKMLSPRALRLSAEDYLQLPPLIVQDVLVDLPSAARGAYVSVENEFRALVEGERVTAANAGVASGKCRQIAGGAVYAEQGWVEMHQEKLTAIVDLVDELGGHPTMVIYEFLHELERLRRLFPEAPALSGDSSPKASAEICRAWNAGELPVLLAHPQSMGHGLNLQGAGKAQIWFTPTWNYELYDQTIRRIWREGRKDPVFVYRLLAKDTVDEAVVMALDRKKRQQDALLDALRAYWRRKGGSDAIGS